MTKNFAYPDKTLIVITGPTASGKTAAAIELAGNYRTVIISADSRQFYREMSIGTAKPSTEELRLVKHYFIDSHSVKDPFNVGDFEKQCLLLLNELFRVYDKVILAGGSGLYIKAVCEGFDQFPTINQGIRNALNHELAEQGIESLQQKLKNADPDYYDEVDRNNPQRIIRALEIYESTGKPFSSFRKSVKNERPFQIIKIGLNMPRPVLYDRINRRVDEMVKEGLVNEVKSLIKYRSLNALNTVGYTELFKYIDGDNTLDEAIAAIKQNTRRFAKRQLTWFNKVDNINWLRSDSAELLPEMIAVVESCTQPIHQSG